MIALTPTVTNYWPLYDSGIRNISDLPAYVQGDPPPVPYILKVPANSFLEIAGSARGMFVSPDGLNYYPARKGDVFPSDSDGAVYLARESGLTEGTFRVLAWHPESSGLRAALGRSAVAGVVPEYGRTPTALTATIASGAAASFVVATAGVYLVTVTGCDMVRELGGDMPNGYSAHEYLTAGTHVFDSISASDSGRVTATLVQRWREVMPS